LFSGSDGVIRVFAYIALEEGEDVLIVLDERDELPRSVSIADVHVIDGAIPQGWIFGEGAMDQGVKRIIAYPALAHGGIGELSKILDYDPEAVFRFRLHVRQS